MDFLEPLQTVWDYLGMHQAPEKADVIVGFGNFNTNIARRAAELYLQGLAPVCGSPADWAGIRRDFFPNRRRCASPGWLWNAACQRWLS